MKGGIPFVKLLDLGTLSRSVCKLDKWESIVMVYPALRVGDLAILFRKKLSLQKAENKRHKI